MHGSSTTLKSLELNCRPAVVNAALALAPQEITVSRKYLAFRCKSIVIYLIFNFSGAQTLPLAFHLQSHNGYKAYKLGTSESLPES